MNMTRMLILAVAAIAAGAAAFLARGLLGGGTPAASARPAPPPIATSEVLVASTAIQPGQPLNPSMVRWQRWPTSNIDSSFITHLAQPNSDQVVAGTVARAPIMEGEPLSDTKIVHADAAGFMAATLSPGMRAVSIPITTESGAGGFILPNDRVDLIMSTQISDSPRRFTAQIVLSNVRVLAVDQTIKQDKGQQVVLAKTATLELTPTQARAVVRAQAAGPLSLALRPLGDSAAAVASAQAPSQAAPANDDEGVGDGVRIIRYGVETAVTGKKE
ncbi:MAG TPA: Flp pilus assembly protein CpaB [Rhizomicrobium sp.]|nr:Flp pilus assembly protein CpaB [Rhizomicrobium sp.]